MVLTDEHSAKLPCTYPYMLYTMIFPYLVLAVHVWRSCPSFPQNGWMEVNTWYLLQNNVTPNILNSISFNFHYTLHREAQVPTCRGPCVYLICWIRTCVYTIGPPIWSTFPTGEGPQPWSFNEHGDRIPGFWTREAIYQTRDSFRYSRI